MAEHELSCSPLLNPSLGDYLAKGKLQVANLPHSLATFVQPTVPYLSTVRWTSIVRKVSIRGDFDAAGDQTQFLETQIVPPDKLRFLVRAQMTCGDATDRVIWMTLRNAIAQGTGVVITKPELTPQSRPVFIERGLVMEPGSSLGMTTETPLTSSNNKMTIIQEFIDVPLGEWVPGIAGGP